MVGPNYVVRRAAAGESAAAIMQQATHDLRVAAWRALGIMGARIRRAAAAADKRTAFPPPNFGAAALICCAVRTTCTSPRTPIRPSRASSPSLTPDEARILRFLYLDGPQPAIDIRTARPLGIGSTLVAGGLSMIAEHAGCRNVDQIHQYLTNLARLGLIEFSKEQVSNPQRYQVVEAQPKVAEAMRQAGRMPKAVHRSIHLNEFGTTFCQYCCPSTTCASPASSRRAERRSLLQCWRRLRCGERRGAVGRALREAHRVPRGGGAEPRPGAGDQHAGCDDAVEPPVVRRGDHDENRDPGVTNPMKRQRLGLILNT